MSVPKGYKRTDVGVIPEEWEVRSCDEVTQRIMVGIVIRPSQYYVKHGVPALRSANIRESGITNTDLVYISQSSNDLLSKSRTQAGDVLTVRTGYPGTSAVVKKEMAGCNCIAILITRPSEGLDSEFFAIWINSNFGKEQVLRNQGGLAQKHFNVGDMKELMVALPSLSEQRAIAEALGDVDALLGALDAAIAKQRDLKRATMQQLLTGQTRLPGFQGEWEVKRLGDVADMGSGGTPPSSVPEYYDGTIPWVSISDMTKGGKIIANTDRNLSAKGFANSAAKMFAAGTVLYAMYASLGECSVAGIPLCTSQAILGVRAKEGLNSSFLYYFLASMKSAVKNMGQQGTQANLNKVMVQNFPLSLPSLREQAAIVSVLDDMDADLTALESRRAKTAALKQAMMQELLTGRIRLLGAPGTSPARDNHPAGLVPGAPRTRLV